MSRILSEAALRERATFHKLQTVESKKVIKRNRVTYQSVFTRGFIPLLFLAGITEYSPDTIEHAISFAGILLTIAYAFSHDFHKIVVARIKKALAAALIGLLIAMAWNIVDPHVNTLRSMNYEIHAIRPAPIPYWCVRPSDSTS